MASKRMGTLYTGVTVNLAKRVYEHKNDIADGFTKKYQLHKLVYYEQHGDVITVIDREKDIKKWNREWKVKLIEKANPYWNDLYDELLK